MLASTSLARVLMLGALTGPVVGRVGAQSAGTAAGVGFRVVHEYDHSRTVGPRRDFEGRARSGPVARPVQILVWYPAQASRTPGRMSFGDYLDLSATRDGPRPLTERDRAATRDGLKGFAQFGLGRQITDAQAAAVYARPLAAVRDGTPARGRFPVVLAATDGSPGTLAPVWESLAARGYVVIASASLSALGALQVTNPAAAIETRIRDLEYLTDHARRYSFADTGRMAIVGVNFDGMAALLYQMKNMRGDAVVSIDGWEGKRGNVETVRSYPFYDVKRMRVPYFLALQDDPDPPPGLAHDLRIFDALKYGPGEHLVVRGLTHAYLVGAGAVFPDAPDEQQKGHVLLVRRIGEFLDAHLAGRPAQVAAADAALSKTDRRRPALPAVPDAAEVEQIVMAERGAERLRTIYREARRANPDVALFSRTALNLFAFRMSRAQRQPESTILLELGTEAFPQSASAQNDLGNGYLQSADTARAVQAFERALELLPADSAFSDSDREQSRVVITQKIGRLRPRP